MQLIFGPVQNILGPVEGQGITISLLERTGGLENRKKIFLYVKFRDLRTEPFFLSFRLSCLAPII